MQKKTEKRLIINLKMTTNHVVRKDDHRRIEKMVKLIAILSERSN